MARVAGWTVPQHCSARGQDERVLQMDSTERVCQTRDADESGRNLYVVVKTVGEGCGGLSLLTDIAFFG
jgi:hypothetical protein